MGAPFAYLARRLLLVLAVLVPATLLTFSLTAFVPGDPAEIILTGRNADEPPSREAVLALRRELGLDRPFLVRYAAWLAGAATGDLGYSFRTGRPVATEMMPRLANTFLLALAAAVLVAALSLGGGLAGASAPGRLRDHATLALSSLLAATPGFFLGLLLLLAFSLGLGLLPVAGSATPRHFVLPALTLGLGGAAVPCRVLRADLLEALQRGYAVAARARGASPRRVLFRHALANSLIPYVTLLGLGFRGVLAGAPFVEAVFDFRGLGTYLVDSIGQRDVPALQACILAFLAFTALTSLATDLAYLAVDPRVRLGEERR